MIRIGSALLLALLTGPLYAGELLASHVEQREERYFLEFDMRIQANPQRVYAIITDFDHLDRINDNIEESKLLHSSDDKHHRVRVVSDACVLFFCKTIRQVQDVEKINNEIVIATTVAEGSDFDYAHARWHVRADGHGTRITFNADLKPSFWMPPLIGPSRIKDKLEDEVITTIKNIERIASQK